MTRLLAALLLLAGCSTNRLSYRSDLSPLAHRGVRALLGATITLGAEYGGARPTLALFAGTIGQVAVTKGILAIWHPERLGSWSAGDAACDLVSSAAVLPIVVAKHSGLKAAIVAGAGWGLAMWGTSKWCVP